MLVEVSAYVADLDEAVVTGLVQQLGCYVLEVGRAPSAASTSGTRRASSPSSWWASPRPTSR